MQRFRAQRVEHPGFTWQRTAQPGRSCATRAQVPQAVLTASPLRTSA